MADGTKSPDQVTDSDDYVTTDIDGAVKLRIPEGSVVKHPPVSIPSLLRNAARVAPHHPALGVKRDNKWVKWTYSDYLKDVECVARAFIKLGLEERKAVAIMGFNSPEWFISDLAAVFCNAVAVGIYATNSPEATKYIAMHCRANIIVVENDHQLQKVLTIKSELPDLKAIVQYTGTSSTADVLSWTSLLKLGGKGEDELLESRLSKVCINQCCHLVYTSGTTGKPKGVMLSHDNMTFTAKALADSYGLKIGSERIVSYLPLSHVAANVLDLVTILAIRGTTYFADKNALKGSLNFTLKEVLPTIFMGVPRVWEKFQEKMMEIGQTSKGLKRQIGNWAKKTGLKRNLILMNHGAGGSSGSLGFKIANKLVFHRVKVALGLDKCQVFAVTAAPFSQSTFEYFLSLDIRIMQIYGMSECSGPHTVNTADAQLMGSIGKTMKGCYTKIDSSKGDSSKADEGEILLGGRNVMMGYLNDEEKTKECLENTLEGWMSSGDVGVQGDDGFLTITGRIKEILITAGGENVPPTPIEDAIKVELPFVSNCLLIGDKRKFLSCLLTLKVEVNPDTMVPTGNLSSTSLSQIETIVGTPTKTVDELLDGPGYTTLAKAVQKGIDEVNKNALSNAQKVQKWVFLRKDFSVPGGELGPTLKVRRHAVLETNKDLVDKFYR